MDEDERRSGVPRRDQDIDLERWRGQIDAQVRQHERNFIALNGDLRGIYKRLDETMRQLTDVQGQVREAREDISEAITTLNASRESEMVKMRDGLRDAVIQSVTTKRDIFRYITAPILVALVIALTIYALTGSVGH